MGKVRIAGGGRAPLKVELDKRLSQAAEISVQHRRQLINGELEHMGLTAFDLLGWEAMLALLESTKDGEPFGLIGPYKIEIHKHVAAAAKRRAVELDAAPNKMNANSDYHQQLLQKYVARW